MPEPIDPTVTDPVDPPVDPVDPDPTALSAGADPDADEDADDLTGADSLGDPGKKALDALKAKRNEYRDEARRLRAENAALKAPKSGDELTPEQIKAAAREEALSELRAPLFNTQAKAAALALGFNDPADALLLVNATDFEVGSDGTFDAEELNDKLSEVLAAKPYLAKNPAGQPGAPAPRTVAPAKAGGTPKTPTLDERIAKAAADGNVDLQISLQNMKLANASR